jgi:predicted membrane metal-binding protein
MINQGSFHESFEREEEVTYSTDRGFGLVFAGFCSLVTAWKLWHSGAWEGWLLASITFLAFALLYPRALAPLNHLWMRFGLVLYRVVNPVILGLMFFACFMPIGLLMRALGKDPLRKRGNPETFWVVRNPHGPDSESMKNQF